MKPRNQHQQVLWYLINWDFPFSLSTVITDSHFYKFQTRLGELEQRYGTLVERTRKPFKNRFGKKGSLTYYKVKDRQKCLKLFLRLQKGLTAEV